MWNQPPPQGHHTWHRMQLAASINNPAIRCAALLRTPPVLLKGARSPAPHPPWALACQMVTTPALSHDARGTPVGLQQHPDTALTCKHTRHHHDSMACTRSHPLCSRGP